MQPLNRNFKGFRWSPKLCHCGCPLSLDIYHGCTSYRCLYCDSHYKAKWSTGGFNYGTPIIHSVRVETKKTPETLSPGLADIFEECIKGDMPEIDDAIGTNFSQYTGYIMNGRPLQMGRLTDPFIPEEREFKVTLAMLRYLYDSWYPITLNTKATWWTEDPAYMELFENRPDTPNPKPENEDWDPWQVRISISTYDDYAKHLEPGVPSAADRLKAIERLSERGVNTVLRLAPIFPLLIDDAEHLIVDAAAAGARAVSAEFLNVPSKRGREDRFYEMSKVLGYDVNEIKIMEKDGIFNKLENLKYLRNVAHDVGLKFVCSDPVGRHLSDMSNCCGIPDSMHPLRFQSVEACRVAKQNGKVGLSDMDTEGAKSYLGSAPALGTVIPNSAKNKSAYEYTTLSDLIVHAWERETFCESLTEEGRDAKGFRTYKLKEGLD